MNKSIISIFVLSTVALAQLQVGDPAPGFYLPRQTGGSFYLSRTVGPKAKAKSRTPVVLSFFQTTCIPCKAEIAELEKLAGEFPGIPIYLIDLNEKADLVTQYIQEFDLQLSMLLDRYGVTGKKYGVVDDAGLARLPNSYIVDSDGKIYYHHVGFKPGDESVYREKLTELAASEKVRLANLEVETKQAKVAEAATQSVGKKEVDLAVGDDAPRFFLPTIDGDSFYLSRTIGPKANSAEKRPIVVSFFQTTCVPCKAEIAEFEKLQNEFPEIHIYLVDLNEKKELVLEYIDRYDLKLRMLLDRYGSVGKKYGVVDAAGLAHLPNSFILAPEGTIYYHHTGFKPGDEAVYREKFIGLTSH